MLSSNTKAVKASHSSHKSQLFTERKELPLSTATLIKDDYQKFQSEAKNNKGNFIIFYNRIAELSKKYENMTNTYIADVLKKSCGDLLNKFHNDKRVTTKDRSIEQSSSIAFNVSTNLANMRNKSHSMLEYVLHRKNKNSSLCEKESI